MRPVVAVLGGIAALALAALGTCAGYWAWLGRDGPDRVERVGPFEVVTHTLGYVAGYNEGRLRRATTEEYSVRHRGAPLAVTGPASNFGDSTAAYDRVNAVVTFPAAEPALVVNVGDPNNRSAFVLLRERGGRVAVTPLGEGSGGVAAEWADRPPGDTERTRDVAVHRARLAGGRWLLLGDAAVLDTRTLTAHRLAAPPQSATLHPFARPLGVAPDGGSLVRLGAGTQPDSLGHDPPLLLVFPFDGGAPDLLPVDRRTMRYGTWEDIDPAWVAHHFAWTRGADGRDHLVRRPTFVPLPHQGRLLGDAGTPSYQIPSARPALLPAFVAFLEREFGAERLGAAAGGAPSSVRIRGRVVNVAYGDDGVSAWADFGTDGALTAEIARHFDAALRTGAYDALFDP